MSVLRSRKKGFAGITLPAVTLVLCLAAAYPQQAELVKLREQLDSDYGFLKCKNDERGQAVAELFGSKGVKRSEILESKEKQTTNYTVTVRGKSDLIVVVGAHYDIDEDGCGAIDNWSGIVLLANLYQRLSKHQGSKSYKFVAFGNEERGLMGSKLMAGSIPKEERTTYCAMVNLDSFGMYYPQAATNLSSKKLVDLSEKVAEEAGLKFFKANVNGQADSVPFQNLGIPSITLHGLADGYEKTIHTRNDTKDKVNLTSLLTGYLLSVRLLEKIDSIECGDLR